MHSNEGGSKRPIDVHAQPATASGTGLGVARRRPGAPGFDAHASTAPLPWRVLARSAVGDGSGSRPAAPYPCRQPFGRPAARSMPASRQLAGRKSAPVGRISGRQPLASVPRRPSAGPDPARTVGIAPGNGLMRLLAGHRQPDRPCSALPLPITNPPMGRSALPAACSALGTGAHGRISALQAGSQLARPASIMG